MGVIFFGCLIIGGLWISTITFLSFLGAKAPLGLVRVSESVSQSVSESLTKKFKIAITCSILLIVSGLFYGCFRCYLWVFQGC